MHKFSKGHNSGIIWRKLFESYLGNPLIISNQVTKFQGLAEILSRYLADKFKMSKSSKGHNSWKR